LTTRALPYRLGAKAGFELRPGGVRCQIELALPGSAQEQARLFGKRVPVVQDEYDNRLVDAVERMVAVG
jgi:hypothetical protein